MDSKNLQQYISEETSKYAETLIVTHCIPHFISFMEQWHDEKKKGIPTEEDLIKFFDISSYAPTSAPLSATGKVLKEEQATRYKNIVDGTHNYNFDSKRCIRFKAPSDVFCHKETTKRGRVCSDCDKLASIAKFKEKLGGNFSENDYYNECVDKSYTKAYKALNGTTPPKSSGKSSVPIKPSCGKKNTQQQEKKTTASSVYTCRPYKKGPEGLVCYWVNIDDTKIIFDSDFNVVGTSSSSLSKMSDPTDKEKKVFKAHYDKIRAVMNKDKEPAKKNTNDDFSDDDEDQVAENPIETPKRKIAPINPRNRKQESLSSSSSEQQEEDEGEELDEDEY